MAEYDWDRPIDLSEDVYALSLLTLQLVNYLTHHGIMTLDQLQKDTDSTAQLARDQGRPHAAETLQRLVQILRMPDAAGRD